MQSHIYSTPQGGIHYWCTPFDTGKRTLVFLPGLTADHYLFEPQTDVFAAEYNILVWDAPRHGQSRPFMPDFSLLQKAQWLHEIVMQYTGGAKPVLIGQSMGGYVAQEYLSLYPGQATGFVSIDSAPVEREYLTGIELWLLKHVKPVYQCYPWRWLQRAGVKGCAESPAGRALMQRMIRQYTHAEYCDLAAHGFRILAEAIEQHVQPIPLCPTLLLAGEHDRAGSALRYNRVWAKRRNLPLIYVPDAGHNANTDNPAFVNAEIRKFVETLS